MKDIIIIGAGKAGYLHYKSYKKIKNIGRIYIVDIKKSQYLSDKKVYSSVKDVIVMNNLQPSNVIIDLCTPYKEFMNLIDEVMSCNCNNVLVEKPFIADSDYFAAKEKLNIIMIQNYLFSTLTIEAKKIINTYKLVPEMIITNFSKNRIHDSLNGRGFSTNHTTSSTNIFEIEMPHQIYIVNYFLDNIENKEIYLVKAEDLVNENIIFKNHAKGIVILKKRECIVVHIGDMTSDITKKEVNIFCRDNYKLEVQYLQYNDDKVVKPGSIKLFNKKELILQKNYNCDDNMFENIEYAYKQFNSNKYDINNKLKIINFSDEITGYINKLSFNDEY